MIPNLWDVPLGKKVLWIFEIGGVRKMAIFDKFFKSVFRPQDERISIFGKNKH